MKLVLPVLLLMMMPLALAAKSQDPCDEQVATRVQVDAGHPWTPPFGLERVGVPPSVRVELTSPRPPIDEYYVAAYREGRETERQALRLTGGESPFFGTVRLASVPAEVALYAVCERDQQTRQLARQAVSWSQLEADAEARPDRRINPVDLGAILVPHGWLLLTNGQTAVIEAAALSRDRDVPDARVKAWFDGGKAAEVAMPLTRNQRATGQLGVQPASLRSDRSVLHVSLVAGSRELWKKEIPAMLVAAPPRWPSFGAVETKLRYDSPIHVRDPKSGARSTISYDTAWDPKLNDVVVSLPNGSRFVFWRGSSYVPFWAGPYNTGFTYEWVETTHPEDGVDTSVEPLGDKELRYGRVRIIESTASRVHVRWTYQPTHHYKVWGDQAVEDFYFYPDGFGVRALTLSSAPGWNYELSEFIVLTPPGAYSLQVLRPRIDVLYLDGDKRRAELPTDSPASGRLTFSRKAPMVFRIFPQDEDRASAVYFSPRDIPRALIVFAPFEEGGQRITPAYWGSHWPLSRDESFDRALIASAPAHNSLMTWGLTGEGKYSAGNNPEPLFSGTAQAVDTLGRSREMMTRGWTWLIAWTDASDDTLRAWAQSYAAPPAIEATGARLDAPAYSPERRALRLVVEAPSVEIRLKPAVRAMNAVFELDGAPKELSSVTIDSKPIAPDAYAWDGATLWVRADVGAAGATIGLRFRGALDRPSR